VNSLIKRLLQTSDDYKPLIPRIIVGLVFLSEGIQKFLYPDTVGAARFAKIGFDDPEGTAAFVATFEIVCGLLVLAGILTRFAALPLLTIMLTAIATTKIPILEERGFWPMAHEARTDFAMTLLLIFLLFYGAGKLSVDRGLSGKHL
jgi:uncharacterized membrane protein YphA (DoxX/SURF4 family)